MVLNSSRRPMFSRMAMYSISGVMMPCSAYHFWVTGWPADALSGLRFRPGYSLSLFLVALPSLYFSACFSER